MIQEQALTEAEPTPTRDPWSGWAKLVDVPAPAEPAVEEPLVEQVEPVEHVEPVEEVEQPEPVESAGVHLAAVVAQLTSELAEERRLRIAADEARPDAEARVHAGEMEVARLAAEVAAAQGRIAELERDRDEVIRRAEELLTAVRERADQRLASELDAAGRHWSELLSEERRRVEALEAERASLVQRVNDAWLAAAVLRRSRPLRPRSSTPDTPEVAELEVLEDLEENQTDPAFAAESPEVAEEIELLRQRLRARRHKPPGIDDVEDGVDQLREARLAREAAPKGRRKR